MSDIGRHADVGYDKRSAGIPFQLRVRWQRYASAALDVPYSRDQFGSGASYVTSSFDPGCTN